MKSKGRLRNRFRIFYICVMLLCTVMLTGLQVFASRPTDGAWVTNISQAELTGTVKTVYEKGIEKLTATDPLSPPTEPKQYTIVSYFASLKGDKSTEYAFVCSENDPMTSGLPVLKIICMRTDEESGEVEITRNEALALKNYFEDSTGEALGGVR